MGLGNIEGPTVGAEIFRVINQWYITITVKKNGDVSISGLWDSSPHLKNTIHYNVILNILLGNIKGPCPGAEIFKIIYKWFTTTTEKIWWIGQL